jgi:alpha-2-macroglobulin
VLVRGRSGEGDRGRPRFKMGVVDLVVDSADRRLAVEVQTDRPSYRPGQQVRARIAVRAADGTPVRAEMAVAVADEGVLQISAFKTPDPLPVFYASWGLGVDSSTTWNRVLRARHPDDGEDDDEEGGDAGGDEAGRIRSRFMATAFWAPAVVTDRAGIAEVVFTAPDNLTAFRVMAVAADTGERFGAGERRFTVSKPLQAVPSLPRFLTTGDEARAAVVVHNNTPATIEVTLNAAVTGLELRAPASQKLTLRAGDAHAARFAVAARAPGQATFRFTASGGGHHDAVEVKIPVHRPVLSDVLVVAEGSTASRARHPLPPVPPGPADGTPPADGATLVVTMDATGMARLAEGLRYLVGYPHGCLEQTTSKVIPMVAFADLARATTARDRGDTAAAASAARGFIAAGIAKILRHQHDDGGFGLWPGAPPETHYTAYALWGLELARAAGHQVDEHALDSGARYLRSRLVAAAAAPGGNAAELTGEIGAGAFAAHVLASLGAADAGLLAQLHERRHQLPTDGRAFLALALAAGGRRDLATAVAAELAARVPGGTGPAVVREGQPELAWYWSSDSRTTALVLLALLEIAPGHPAITRLGDGLLGARVDGRWRNTQENLYALLALARLGKARAAAAPVTATVSVGGQLAGRHEISGRGVFEVRFPLPLAALAAPPPVLIEALGGEVHYAARLDVERPLGAARAQDRGLRVERQYLDPATGRPLARVAVGDTVKVRVTVHSPARLPHVAVIDPLPAGLEPVLERFERSVADSGPRRGSLWWHHSATAWQHQELRDDRASLFADILAPGASSREYLARATTPGTFAVAPATAEAMYQPATRGHSAATTFVVEAP